MYVENKFAVFLFLNGIFCAQLNSYKHHQLATKAMKPVEYLIEVTQKVLDGAHHAMHVGLEYNSEDEGDVETNPEMLKSHMKTIQAELDSLFRLRDCLSDYLEVSAQFMEQLVRELQKYADPNTHPVLYDRMVHHLMHHFHTDGDSPHGKPMEQRYKSLQQASSQMTLEFAKEGTPDGERLIDDVAEIIRSLEISSNTEMATPQVDWHDAFFSLF